MSEPESVSILQIFFPLSFQLLYSGLLATRFCELTYCDILKAATLLLFSRMARLCMQRNVFCLPLASRNMKNVVRKMSGKYCLLLVLPSCM